MHHLEGQTDNDPSQVRIRGIILMACIDDNGDTEDQPKCLMEMW